MPITLNGSALPQPQNYANTLMKESFEASVVGQLSPSEPIILGDNVIPVYEGGIEAGVVGEGEAKPVSEASMSHKVIRPIKLATIVVVSDEAVKLNPGNMLNFVRADLSNAITRAVDLLVLHGRSPRTGAVVPDVSYVNETTNRVEVNESDPLGPQLLAGYDLAANGGDDPDGFAFDTRYRTKVALANQATSADSIAMPNLNQAASTVAGLPAAYGRSVSGRVGSSVDTNVKGFVGDWGKVRWGFSENISIQTSSEATIVDGSTTYHLFQQNLRALLVEAQVGWTVLDPQAFAAYEVTPAP